MTAREELLTDIEAFIAKHELRPTHFGLQALNDPAFVFRLRQGKSVRSDTIDRLREFMRDYRPPKRRPQRGNEGAVAA